MMKGMNVDVYHRVTSPLMLIRERENYAILRVAFSRTYFFWHNFGMVYHSANPVQSPYIRSKTSLLQESPVRKISGMVIGPVHRFSGLDIELHSKASDGY